MNTPAYHSHFDQIFDQYPDALFITNKECKILRCNPAAEQLFKSTREQLTKKYVFDFIEEMEDYDRCFQQLQEANKSELTGFTQEGNPLNLMVYRLIELEPDLYQWTIRDISSNKKIESELEENSIALDAYFESNPANVILLGKKYEIKHFNKKAEDFVKTHFKKNITLGESIADYIEGDTLKLFQENFNKALKGQSFSFETHIPFDNDNSWWEVGYAPTKNRQGEIVGVSFTALNIQEKVTARQASAEREDFLNQLADNVPNGIIFQQRVNDNGQLEITFAKGSLESIIPPDNKISRDFLKGIVHPDDLEGLVNAQAEKVKNASALSYQFRALALDNKYHWIWVRSKPRRTALGELVWDGIAVDVTPMKSLEERNLLLYQVVQKTDNLVFICDALGLFLWANKSFLDETGYSLKEIYNYPITKFIPESESVKLVPETKELIGDQKNRMEVRFIRKDGSKLWLDLSQVVTLDELTKEKRVIHIGIDITTRKFSEEKFKIAFHDSPDIKIIIRERDNHIVDVNKRIAELTGYSAEEFLGDKYGRILKWNNEAERTTFITQYQETGKAIIETTLATRQGKLLHVFVRSKRIIIEGESYRLTLLRDISSLKEAEAKLKSSEVYLKNLISNLNVGVIKQDKEARVLDFNKRALEILGVSENQILGKTSYDPMWKVLRPNKETFPADELPVPICIRTKKVVSDVVMGIQTPLGFRWAMVTATPYLDESGDINYVICTLSDITKIRESEMLLERTTQRFQSLVNTQSSHLVRIDMEGKYSFANKTFCDFFDITEKDIIGTHSFQTIIPEDHQACLTAVKQALANPGKVVSIRLRKPHKTLGVATSDWEFMGIIDPDGGVSEIQCVGYDVTEKIRSSNRLKRIEANMTSIINNTPMLVWSVDRQFRLISMNTAMKNILYKVHNYEVDEGNYIVPALSKDATTAEFVTSWLNYYTDALNGKAFRITNSIDDKEYEFFLNPIYEGEEVTGVSVFANDITDNVKTSNELLELNKKVGEMKLMALRSAMNPHFIFNALNSIQYFITANDRLNAINYLSKFSKLVRGVLNNSNKEYVKLENELEIIKYYIELEILRFENKFTYTIAVNEQVDKLTIEIPPMIIQPYIENAILHGLYGKEERGHLHLEITYAESKLKVTIEDNGIGREKSAQLRNKNFPQHKSVGMELTKARIDSAAENSDSVVIEDLKDSLGNGTGTRVTLLLSYQ